MDRINLGIIGTGWCGGIHAVACAADPLIDDLHIAETNPERQAEVEAQVGAVTAVALDQPVLVTPEQARQVMAVYIAADLSAERGEPVTLPLNGDPATLGAVA